MNVLLAVMVVVIGVAIGRTMARLRRWDDGPERLEMENSLWLLGGTGLVMLSLLMGLERLRLTGPVQWSTLGLSAVLVGVGGWKTKRLVAARREQLQEASRTATTAVDRVESLEALAGIGPGPGRRVQVAMVGGKLVMAGTNVWVASVTQSPSATATFGVIAVASVVWAGMDIREMVKTRSVRLLLDGEIDSMLARTEAAGELPSDESDKRTLPIS